MGIGLLKWDKGDKGDATLLSRSQAPAWECIGIKGTLPFYFNFLEIIYDRFIFIYDNIKFKILYYHK
jgi:hypothetical protein